MKKLSSQKYENLDRAYILGSASLATWETFEASQVCLSFLKIALSEMY